MIELLVVCSIIAILVTIAIPMFTEAKITAKNARAMTEMRDLDNTLNAYYIDNNGTYPATLAAVGRGGATDPWGNPYIYNMPPTLTDTFLQPLNPVDSVQPNNFDLYSKGSDGQDDTGDFNADVNQDNIIRGFSRTGVSYIGLQKDWSLIQ